MHRLHCYGGGGESEGFQGLAVSSIGSRQICFLAELMLAGEDCRSSVESVWLTVGGAATPKQMLFHSYGPDQLVGKVCGTVGIICPHKLANGTVNTSASCNTHKAPDCS